MTDDPKDPKAAGDKPASDTSWRAAKGPVPEPSSGRRRLAAPTPPAKPPVGAKPRTGAQNRPRTWAHTKPAPPRATEPPTAWPRSRQAPSPPTGGVPAGVRADHLLCGRLDGDRACERLESALTARDARSGIALLRVPPRLAGAAARFEVIIVCLNRNSKRVRLKVRAADRSRPSVTAWRLRMLEARCTTFG